MKIRVPATSANIGVGFDSLGMAVNLYLEVEILEETDKWIVEHNMIEAIPKNQTNLVVRIALDIDPNIHPRRLKIHNDIPLSRGLGSSSSAIVAGIELASILGSKPLNLDEKIKLACDLEGHPDNVLPAILGGLVIGSYYEDQLHYVKVDIDELELVAVIPNDKISTEAMRKVLPKRLNYMDAVNASAISNVVIASLLTKNYKQAGLLIERDLLHEPYREHLIPQLNGIRRLAKEYNAIATYLSGSGSTIMTLFEKGQCEGFYSRVQCFKESAIKHLEITDKGVEVFE